MASTSAAGPSSSLDDAAQKRADRMARFKNLHLKRNEARKLNHQEVVEEDKRAKLPKNWDAKKRRLEWEEEEELKKQNAEAEGLEYDRVKNLETQADNAEKWEKKKAKKRNPDEGFADYQTATHRQYQGLTKQLKPDKDHYQREKDKMGEAFYPTVDTLGVMEHKDSEENVDKLVKDLEKQAEKRAKYSRRRTFDPDADIDYINERNMKFNQKLERFYGKYTTEIKQNLERGTAV